MAILELYWLDDLQLYVIFYFNFKIDITYNYYLTLFR